MPFAKYVLPALAIAGSAAAVCNTTATLTIQNGGDATALATCTTFTGSIALATGVSGAIAFDGIKSITGDFNAVGASGLTTLSGNSLSNIGGAFNLQGLTVLTAVNFPALTNVGSLNWQTLPQLQGLGLTSTIQNAGAVSIVDTQLASLTGINLTSAASLNIASNVYLTSVNMALNNVTGNLNLASNNQGAMTATFGNLTTVGGSFSVSQLSSLSIDSLRTISQTANFINNVNMQTLSAPSLTGVGGLIVTGNSQLNNLSFPALARCSSGALVLSGNNALTGNISFPALTTISGALNVTGGYSAFSAPALKDVEGVTALTSTQDITSTCNTFKTYFSNGILKKSPVCAGKAATASGTASGTAASGTSTAPASTTTRSAAGNVQASAGVAGLAGVFALFALL